MDGDLVSEASRAVRPPSFPAGGGLRVSVGLASPEAVVEAVARRLAQGRGFALATLNLDHLVKLRRLPAFRRAYSRMDLVTADGRPVVWLSRLAGRQVALAPGSELVEPLCALAARRRAPVALYGSDAPTLERAAARLKASHPGLEVALALAPPQGFDPEGEAAAADAERVAASGARLCFLALGAPKQEIFAVRARELAPACGFLCVGAGLDFLGGAQRRAPPWMRRLALEWLWRLAGAPRRLGGRYLACAALLPALALDALRHRANRR
jgi:exopolysaccharide biosynthesis WecB/TagA/CpsF family protein